MPSVDDPNVLVELSTSDDAAVYRITEDIAAVLTVDFFTPIVDDPYDFGRIAVTNALSDVYAMGAVPAVALNLIAFPVDSQPIEVLEAILRGGADQAARAKVSIVGGHSIEDPEPKYGLCVFGLAAPDAILTNSAAKPGDKLILTKPIGTGIIATAIKVDAAPPDVVKRAVEVMTMLNGPAAEAMKQVGCSACTDVTGFGLLGHLHEMVSASGVGARIRLHDVPLIEGVRELAAQAAVPGGTFSNMDFLSSRNALEWSEDVSQDDRLILCDAQTSGGLLISVEPKLAAKMVEALEASDVLCAAEIGEITTDSQHKIRVEP